MKKSVCFLTLCLLGIFFLIPSAWSVSVAERLVDRHQNLRMGIFILVPFSLIALLVFALWKRKFLRMVRWLSVFLIMIGMAGQAVELLTLLPVSSEYECSQEIFWYDINVIVPETYKDTKKEQAYKNCLKETLKNRKIIEQKAFLLMPFILICFVYLVYPVILFLCRLFKKVLTKLIHKGSQS